MELLEAYFSMNKKVIMKEWSEKIRAIGLNEMGAIQIQTSPDSFDAIYDPVAELTRRAAALIVATHSTNTQIVLPLDESLKFLGADLHGINSSLLPKDYY